MGIIANEALRVLNLIIDVDISVTLFANDWTPSLSDASDASDYTPVSASGADPLILNSWGTPTTSEGKAEAIHALTWNLGSGASGYAYGVFLRDYASGDLITGIRFPSPVALAPGVVVSVDLKGFVKDPSVS